MGALIRTALGWLARSIATVADWLPGWIWAAICAGALAHGCVVERQRDSARAELAALRADVATQADAQAEVVRIARLARDRVQADQDQAMQTADERTTHEKTALADRVRALERELQHRPDRPAGAGADVPGRAGPAVAGCTGDQLYRPDAAFLTREAAAADLIRIDLLNCRAKYDAAAAASATWQGYQRTLQGALAGGASAAPPSPTTTATPKGTTP